MAPLTMCLLKRLSGIHKTIAIRRASARRKETSDA